jgi:adenylate cyclase
MERRLAAILAADVVGYSALMSSDEAGTVALLRAHRETVFEPQVVRHGGRIAKLMGDGSLVEFASATGAVEAALAIQRKLATARSTITLRIGINLGDVSQEDDEIYGDGINIAARLEALAPNGGICLSAQVYDCLGATLASEFADAGVQRLKNITRPVQVYRWPASAGQLTQSDLEFNIGRSAAVTVARFEDTTANPVHRHIAAGLSEDLVTALSRIHGLRAVAIGADEPQVLVQKARELGTEFLLRGMVRVGGNRLRVSAQLIECANDEIIWGKRFDGTVDGDIFKYMDEVTDQIASGMQVHLSDGEQAVLWRREAGDDEAYDLFLEARAAYSEYNRRGNLRSRGLFEQSLSRSPEFVTALVGLARSHIEDAAYGWSEDKASSVAQAHLLLEQAFDLSPDHALAHSELAHLLMIEGKFDEARKSALRSVKLAPDVGDVFHVLAYVYICVGEFEEALKFAREAVRRSPTAPEFYLTAMAEAYIGLQDWSQALSVAKRILERRTGWLMVKVMEIIALQGGRREVEAKAAAQALCVSHPKFTTGRWLQMIPYADRHDVPELLTLLKATGVPE